MFKDATTSAESAIVWLEAIGRRHREDPSLKPTAIAAELRRIGSYLLDESRGFALEALAIDDQLQPTLDRD